MKHFVISDRDLEAVAEQYLNAVAHCAQEYAAGGFSPAVRQAGDLVCQLHRTLLAQLGLKRGGHTALTGGHKQISYAEPEPGQIVLICLDLCDPATNRIVPLSINTYQRLRRCAECAGVNVEAGRE